MIRQTLRMLTVVGATGALTACSNYFTGPGIDANPNVPSVATADQQFVGFQAFNTYNLTGDVNRVITLFTQQMAGTGRQWAGYDHYAIAENDFVWDGFYTGGGLVDIRQVQQKVAGDKFYLGVAQVWEALTVGMIADVWGNVPYSEALGTVATPKLDPQATVYASLQTLLDQAITNINAGGNGPRESDLIYGGDKASWLEAANTLKARLYLHTAEIDPTSYAKALAAANKGISTGSHDFTSYQSSTKGEENHWFQFRLQRGTDISAGKFLVDLMKSRNDPRLTKYFSPGAAANGQIIGAAPNSEDDGTFAWLSAVRADAGYRQPIMTYGENMLIKAEAQYKTGDEAGARTTLNAWRGTVGLPAVSTAGAALYTDIMQEKYVTLFQNPEAWNDYKRTCYPNLTPADGSNTLMARLPYPGTERSTNPNIPSPSQAQKRNPNDPKTATSTDGTACKGQG